MPAVADPLADPLQFTAVADVETESRAGWVITAAVDELQLFASVIVQVYVPAGRLEAVLPFPPEGLQEYVNGPVPPAMDAVADPLAVPLHRRLALLAMLAVPPELELTVTPVLWVQPFASVTVTEYVPAGTEVAVALV